MQFLDYLGRYFCSYAVIQRWLLQILSCGFLEVQHLAVLSGSPLLCYIIVICNVAGIIATETLVGCYAHFVYEGAGELLHIASCCTCAGFRKQLEKFVREVMPALADTFVFDYLHGIRHAIGKGVSSLHDVAGLYCHCTYTWRIYRIGTDCNVVTTLRSRTYR